MSRCGNCGAATRHGAEECPECGVPLFAKDRKAQGVYQEPEAKRQAEEKFRTYDWMRKHYGLEAKRPEETIEMFAKRINEESVPYLLAEHKAIRERREQSASKAREPGEDDDQVAA